MFRNKNNTRFIRWDTFNWEMKNVKMHFWSLVKFGFPSWKSNLILTLIIDDLVDGLEDEDDLVAADLDMHSLILSSNPQEHAVRIWIFELFGLFWPFLALLAFFGLEDEHDLCPSFYNFKLWWFWIMVLSNKYIVFFNFLWHRSFTFFSQPSK